MLRHSDCGKEDVDMRKKLLNNISFKVIALLVAVLVWIAIVNTNDPYDKITLSKIPVNLVNTGVLTDNGYVYEVKDGTDYVTITVKGPRSIVENLKVSDFKAEAILLNEFTQTSHIDIKCVNANIDTTNLTIYQKTDMVKLDIQNRIAQSYDVETVINGTPANGYYTDLSLISISPSTIRVSGPENIIEKIASVKAVVDVIGENTNITTSIKPILYDENGSVIDSDKLTFSKNQITCSVGIYKKRTVDIKFAISGSVEDGYKYMGITSDLNQVVISGPDSELAKISSIDIPATLIDISDLTDDKVFQILVAQYVPNTVKYLTEETYANVTVDIEELKRKTVNLNNKDISIENLNQAYKLEFEDNSINVITVSGVKAVLDELTSDDINAVIDLTGLREGSHSVPIKVTTKKNAEIIGSYKVNIKITKKDSPSIDEDDM